MRVLLQSFLCSFDVLSIQGHGLIQRLKWFLFALHSRLVYIVHYPTMCHTSHPSQRPKIFINNSWNWEINSSRFIFQAETMKIFVIFTFNAFVKSLKPEANDTTLLHKVLNEEHKHNRKLTQDLMRMRYGIFFSKLNPCFEIFSDMKLLELRNSRYEFYITGGYHLNVSEKVYL